MKPRGLAIGTIVVLLLAGGGYVLWSRGGDPPPHVWSANEQAVLASLWIGSLPALPPDPSNRVGDDPAAAELGRRFFFDERFSSNGEVACATCHQPGKKFTDGLPRAKGIGTTKRHAPSIVGMAYEPWFFWDGRKDSQWAQALGPMEDPGEHGGTRTQYAHLVASRYADDYEAVFGALPDLSDHDRFPLSAGPNGDETAKAAWDAMSEKDRRTVSTIYANIGKAIAAYERRIRPGVSRFDEYVDAVRNGTADPASVLTDDEALGLRLFIGRANCTQCHNGPLLTNGGFHNIGLPLPPGTAFDSGRIAGVTKVLEDEFNCFSPYSDASDGECQELRHIKREGYELVGSFKVPSLRNVGDTAPYMHLGQFATLGDVLAHYNQAPTPLIGHSDLVPLDFSRRDLARLEAFLRTLGASVDAPAGWLEPPADLLAAATQE